MDPLIISAALSGGAANPGDSPYLTTGPASIAEAAVDAWKAGAAIVHIHARDEDGKHTGDVAYFKKTVDLIRDAGCDVLINLTTSFGGVRENDAEVRMSPLTLRPDIASYDAGTLNFGEKVFMNSLPFLRDLGKAMQRHGVKPEIEIFDAGMVATVQRLVRDGYIDEPPFYQFILGVAGGAPATAKHLLHLIDCIPPGSPWSVGALGRGQLPMNTLAIALGGHARTGLEDNIYLNKGEPGSNAMLVARLVQVAALYGRPVATVEQAKEILNLPAKVHEASAS